MNDRRYLLKGATFLNLITYIKKKRGKDGVERVFKLLREENPDLYIDPRDLSPKRMYPEICFNGILETYDREYGKGDLREAYNFGVYDVENMGIMGLFVSFLGDPMEVIRKAPEGWKSYHEGGELVLTQMDPGHCVFELRDYLVSRTVCTELTGFFTAASKKTRGKNIKVEHTACACDGASACEFTVTWDP